MRKYNNNNTNNNNNNNNNNNTNTCIIIKIIIIIIIRIHACSPIKNSGINLPVDVAQDITNLLIEVLCSKYK
jgi:putative component of membrane protein insertase Oxa1/YidC/SpoIIIJ protein YidD